VNSLSEYEVRNELANQLRAGLQHHDQLVRLQQELQLCKEAITEISTNSNRVEQENIQLKVANARLSTQATHVSELSADRTRELSVARKRIKKLEKEVAYQERAKNVVKEYYEDTYKKDSGSADHVTEPDQD